MISQGLNNLNSVVSIRYFELAVQIALISEPLSEAVKNCIDIVLQKFFQQDILTQISVMDLVRLLGKKMWTSLLLVNNNFIGNLFKTFRGEGQDNYGIVENNLIVLAASIYS